MSLLHDCESTYFTSIRNNQNLPGCSWRPGCAGEYLLTSLGNRHQSCYLLLYDLLCSNVCHGTSLLSNWSHETAMRNPPKRPWRQQKAQAGNQEPQGLRRSSQSEVRCCSSHFQDVEDEVEWWLNFPLDVTCLDLHQNFKTQMKCFTYQRHHTDIWILRGSAQASGTELLQFMKVKTFVRQKLKQYAIFYKQNSTPLVHQNFQVETSHPVEEKSRTGPNPLASGPKSL